MPKCCRGCGRDTEEASGFCRKCRPAPVDRDEDERRDYLRQRREDPFTRDVEDDTWPL